MMKQFILLGTLWIAVLLLSGCDSATIKTTVNPTGGYTRNLRFSVSGTNGAPPPSLRQEFVLPAGSTWNTKIIKGSDSHSYTAIKTFDTGETDRNDLTVIAAKNATVTNTTTIRPLQNGIWEYREVLHWNGPVDSDFMYSTKQISSSVKKALPPEFATDAHADAVANRMIPNLSLLLLGPPRPLAPEFLNPDLSMELLQQGMYKPINESLQQEFGDKMTNAQRADTTRAITTTVFDYLNSDAANKSATTSSGGSSDSVNAPPLTFVFVPPGKVVDTNGIYSENTGEVVWGLYPQSADFGDVVLTADYQPTLK